MRPRGASVHKGKDGCRSSFRQSIKFEVSVNRPITQPLRGTRLCAPTTFFLN